MESWTVKCGEINISFCRARGLLQVFRAQKKPGKRTDIGILGILPFQERATKWKKWKMDIGFVSLFWCFPLCSDQRKMARKQRFEMPCTGPNVSNFPNKGTPLHAENPFPDLFLESKKRFFLKDQALFQDLKREIEDEPAILTTGISRTGEVKQSWSKLPVALNLFSGSIEEGDSHEPNRDMCDGPQETNTKNAGKVDLEIEPEVCRGLDEPHALGGQKNQGELESGFQTCGLISSISANDTPYQETNLDKRIIMVVLNTGLYRLREPDSAWNEDAEMELEMCKDELQHQATQNKHHFDKVGKAVGKTQKVQDRERKFIAMNEFIAMNAILESVSDRAHRRSRC